MDVSVPQVHVLEALERQVPSISHQILEKCSDVDSGKEEFLTRTYELKMQCRMFQEN